MNVKSNRGPATLRQIAAQSGVSVQTVSQILNDKGAAYRAETREKVLETARLLGYRWNHSARVMRRGRTECVALLLSEETYLSLLPRELLDGIQDALNERNLHLTVARAPDHVLEDGSNIPKLLREWMADGLLINYNARIPERMIAAIADQRIPSIWMNSQQETDCIFPDDEQGARLGTEYLLSLGHERIAYSNFNPSEHYSAAARQRGYEAAMRSAGRVPRLLNEPPEIRDYQHAEARWIDGPDRPTAILSYGPPTTAPLLFTALRQGISIPEELSLLHFASHPNELPPLPVDCIRLPQREMGRLAVELLEQRIAELGTSLPPRAVPLDLVTGWTTAPRGPGR